MKKQWKILLCLLLVVAMALSLAACGGDSEEEEWGGKRKPSQSDKDKNDKEDDGNTETPPVDGKTYRIRTVEDLLGVAKYMESHVLDAEVVILLENDLVVNDTADFHDWAASASRRAELVNFTPIKYFSGTFDGQGHTISGLYCCVDDGEDQYSSATLIYNLYPGATLKNLNIKDSLFYSAQMRTTAPLVATNRGTVQNCHVRAEVCSNAMYISMLTGSTREGGQILDCTADGQVIHMESGNQIYMWRSWQHCRS